MLPPASRHHPPRPGSLATVLVWMSLAVAVLATGCDSANKARVGGRITFGGEPVARAFVMFVPAAGPSSGAVTDEQGVYRLATGGRYGSWVFTGTCQVSIAEADPTTARRTFVIPPRLADPAISGLGAEIMVGKNVIDFELPAK